MKRTIIPAFTQLSITDFGPAYLEAIGLEDQICIGFWDKADYGWNEDNIVTKWFRTAGGVRMEVYDYDQMDNHKRLGNLLNTNVTTPDQLRDALINLGYEDVTDS